MFKVTDLSYKLIKPNKRKGMFGRVRDAIKPLHTTEEILSGLSFELNTGETIYILSDSKEERKFIMKLLTHQTKASAGEISNDPNSHVSVVTSEKKLWPELSFKEQLPMYASLHNKPLSKILETAEYYATLLNIKDKMNIKIWKLDNNTKLLMNFLISLLKEPEIVVIYDLFDRLDLSIQKLVTEFITRLGKELGMSFIVIDNQLQEFTKPDSKILVIDEGKVLTLTNYQEVVSKYATKKYINLTLHRVILVDELKNYGEIIEQQDDSITIKIDRDQVTRVTAEIVRSFPMKTIGVSESTLKDIINAIKTNQIKIANNLTEAAQSTSQFPLQDQ